MFPQIQHLSGVIDNVQSGILVHDDLGTIRCANQAALQILNLGAADLETVDFNTLNVYFLGDSELEPAHSRHPVALVIENRTPIIDEIIGWRDTQTGQLKWAKISVIPELDSTTGMIQYIVSTLQEYTHEHHMDGRLVRTEEKYRGLLHNLPIGVATLRRRHDLGNKIVDLYFTDANRSFIDTLGYNPKGKWFSECVADDKESRLSEILSNPSQSEITDEYLRIGSDKRWYKMHLFRDIDDQIILTLTDIDAVKNDQIYLQRANKSLSLRYTETEKANRNKQSFLASFSHEIRTPMNGIMGVTDLMECIPDLSPEMQEYLGLIRSCGDRMLGILNGIIDMSKIEAGAQEKREETFSLSRVLDDLDSLYRLQADQKGIGFSVEKHIPQNCDQVFLDKTKLQQILGNFITNALKFTQKGEIKVYCSCVEGIAHFRVKDTGIGIPKSEQQRIFQEFEQSSLSRNINTEGVGLGLAITDALVRLLGGRIHLWSEPGVGSEFSFSLPCPKHS